MKNLPTIIAEKKDLIPKQDEWTHLKEICEIAVKSGLIPQKNPEQAITIALKGRELGIPPMQAFSHIAVIQGKPSMSSELMLALIYQRIHGVKIEFIETSNTVCRLNLTRPGEKTEEWRFDMEDAKAAQVTGKDNWKKYPAAMLRARCISAMARAKCPDALMGVSYTPEELGDTKEPEIKQIEIVYDGNTGEVIPEAKQMFSDPIQKMLTAFETIGISKEEVEKLAGIPVEKFTEDTLAVLRLSFGQKKRELFDKQKGDQK